MAARRAEADRWQTDAKAALGDGREDAARAALVRKREATDMAAAVEQELDGAKATHRHLQTTARALEARLSDARRKRASLDAGEPVEWAEPILPADPVTGETRDTVEDELEALRREMGG